MRLDSQALDRHITGNYGEDQFRDVRCGHKMRTGSCQLDENHRGRHSTVVHYCDSCGQYRRGSQPAGFAHNPWDGEIEAQFCWFCMNVKEGDTE